MYRLRESFVVVDRRALVDTVLVSCTVVACALLGGSRYIVWVGLAWVVGLPLSLALHEVAHALMAIRLGLKVHQVRLTAGLGGRVRRERTSNPRIQLMVAGAGPVATMTLLVVFAVLALTTGAGAQAALGNVAAVNGLLLLGTLPVRPGSDVAHSVAAWKALRARRSGMR